MRQGTWRAESRGNVCQTRDNQFSGRIGAVPYMFLQPGARLGPYEIVSLLGAGGMGEVYRARDPRLGRDVAIKVLPAAFSTSVDRLHRFEQEARAAAALAHPNILAVYDIGTARRPRPSSCRSCSRARRCAIGCVPVRSGFARRFSWRCRSRTGLPRPTKRGSPIAI